jgi:hypothetical protein
LLSPLSQKGLLPSPKEILPKKEKELLPSLKEKEKELSPSPKEILPKFKGPAAQIKNNLD